MKLEIGNFYVRDIVFGDRLSYQDGVLTIQKEEALEFIKQDDRITEAELYIVKPGDKVRLCPVKEAIEPRVRPDGRSAFPGYTGDLAPAGSGVTHALKNCSVLVVGRHWGGFQDGLIDMSGEGQKYTLFGQLNNLVLVADTNEEFEKREQQKKNDALRRAGHCLAEYVAGCVKELVPEETEVFELGGMIKRDAIGGLCYAATVPDGRDGIQRSGLWMGYEPCCSNSDASKRDFGWCNGIGQFYAGFLQMVHL